VTGGKERIRYFIDTFKTAMDAGVELDDFIPALHQSKTRHFVSLLQSGAIPLRPGVERLLNEARASGLRLAIATTTTPENVTALLTATLGNESIAWFDVIAAGDVVAEKKPAPDIYQYALQKLGLKDSECLAFEDSENGLLSATRAGLKTIVTVNDYTCIQDFSAAAIVLDQLDDPDFQLKTMA
jgi:HAD superfamily hydrolase (TIGR01509 family)